MHVNAKREVMRGDWKRKKLIKRQFLTQNNQSNKRNLEKVQLFTVKIFEIAKQPLDTVHCWLFVRWPFSGIPFYSQNRAETALARPQPHEFSSHLYLTVVNCFDYSIFFWQKSDFVKNKIICFVSIISHNKTNVFFSIRYNDFELDSFFTSRLSPWNG